MLREWCQIVEPEDGEFPKPDVRRCLWPSVECKCDRCRTNSDVNAIRHALAGLSHGIIVMTCFNSADANLIKSKLTPEELKRVKFNVGPTPRIVRSESNPFQKEQSNE